MSLMGIDVGTTRIKVIVINPGGVILTENHLEHEIIPSIHAGAEVNASVIWEHVKRLVRKSASDIKNDPVKAICISSFGEAFVPVTKERQILANAILSSDLRGQDEIDGVFKNISIEDFYAINPNIPGPGYSLSKMLWIKENDPELFDKADFLLLMADFIAFMLGAFPYTSNSLANRTLLFDLDKNNWSADLLALTGIPETKLGEIVNADVITGIVSRNIALDLGLPIDTKIVAGGHDQCLNALGSGCFSAGDAVCGIGTYECITPVFEKVKQKNLMFHNGLNIEHHVIKDLYVTFIYNQAGSLIKWFRDTFASQEMKEVDSLSVYELLNRELKSQPTCLMVLPYFQPSGSPRFIRDAKGAILGLTTSTNRGEILKSIMESICFYFYEVILNLKDIDINAHRVTATGGGARSDSWLQIHADIFGVPFVRTKIIEASALGAAILAGLATEEWRSAEEACSLFVREDCVFDPDIKRHEIYLEKFEKYKLLLPLLHEYLKHLI